MDVSRAEPPRAGCLLTERLSFAVAGISDVTTFGMHAGQLPACRMFRREAVVRPRRASSIIALGRGGS